MKILNEREAAVAARGSGTNLPTATGIADSYGSNNMELLPLS